MTPTDLLCVLGIYILAALAMVRDAKRKGD
jgi:hypothetical protein